MLPAATWAAAPHRCACDFSETHHPAIVGTYDGVSWHRAARSGETGGANGRRLLEDRGVVGAYSSCGCSASAHHGSTAGDRVLGVSTGEPGHRGTARRLHARRLATVVLGNS